MLLLKPRTKTCMFPNQTFHMHPGDIIRITVTGAIHPLHLDTSATHVQVFSSVQAYLHHFSARKTISTGKKGMDKQRL